MTLVRDGLWGWWLYLADTFPAELCVVSSPRSVVTSSSDKKQTDIRSELEGDISIKKKNDDIEVGLIIM